MCLYIIICTSCFYNFNIDIFHIMLIRVKIKEIRIRIRIRTGACGVGVSDVYMLKSVGDSTPPCGTPF